MSEREFPAGPARKVGHDRLGLEEVSPLANTRNVTAHHADIYCSAGIIGRFLVVTLGQHRSTSIDPQLARDIQVVFA